MIIRPKNIIKLQGGGVAGVGRTNNDWVTYVHSKQKDKILDLLKKYGEASDYADWLNDMQSQHAQIRKEANIQDFSKDPVSYNENVKRYQQRYLGQQFNDDKALINQSDLFNYNTLGIANAYSQNIFTKPGTRTSGDNPTRQYTADGLYSGITDWRYLLGRDDDWDKHPEEFNNWQEELKKRGWETYKDTDGYYKLRRYNYTPGKDLTGRIRVGYDNEDSKSKTKFSFKNVLPELISAGRLVGNIWNNNRVFDEQIKGIKPTLKQSYLTHRQNVGDEASKQGYYKRAAQLESAAAQPFTSNADRAMAYRMEATSKANELRAQGDLVDNQMIQKTSDESNAHQWANTQRNTEVANANLEAINRAEELKHNLIAQKYSANWTSADNYLEGIETRLRQNQAQKKTLANQIDYLEMQDLLANDPQILDAQKKYEKIYKNNGEDPTNKKVIEAKTKLKNIIRRRKIELYTDYLYAKKGGKVTYKQKDDLLYKSIRDRVEHFRKMSKMSSDALDRKKPKIEKLAAHPKKMQAGGVAPFTIYKPVVLGGEQSITTESSTPSNKEKDDLTDIIFKLFKDTNLLPSDANQIYLSFMRFLNQKNDFGDVLDTEDMQSIFVKHLLELNNAKRSKENFTKVESQMYEQDAADEFALDDSGNFIVQDNGKLRSASWKEIVSAGGKLNPLKNIDLINLRQWDTTYALQKGDLSLLRVVTNGIGLSKIANYLKSILPSIGDSEKSIEGFTRQDSNNIKAGLELLKDAPAGTYKFSEYSKNLSPEQRIQAAFALKYLQSITPPKMMNVLKAHANIEGTTVQDIFVNLINSGIDTKYEVKLDPTENESGLKGNAITSFLLGQGQHEKISFNTGTSFEVQVNAVHGTIQDHSGTNLGQGHTLKDATNSTIGNSFVWEKATFGGTRFNDNGLSHAILHSSDMALVTLPVTTDRSGNRIPDFQFAKKMEEVEDWIRANNITDKNEINNLYVNASLPPKYNAKGELNPRDYDTFAAIQVTVDDKALKGGKPQFKDEVTEADSQERELFEETMLKNGVKDYNLSNGWGFRGKDNLYKGTVFIPIRDSIEGSLVNAGQAPKINLPSDANSINQQQYLQAVSKYQKPTISMEQIKQ